MDYRLELKPFEGKEGQKYKVIQITDLTLHKNKRPTQNVAKKISDSLATQEPGRIYSKIDKQDAGESHALTLTLLQSDPEFVKMVREEEEKGYKILIGFPKTGIPMMLGKDALEFMDGTKGKRIIRKLYKKDGKDKMQP